MVLEIELKMLDINELRSPVSPAAVFGKYAVLCYNDSHIGKEHIYERSRAQRGYIQENTGK